MSKESYAHIRNIFHSYSRAPLAEGQTQLDQSGVKAGHTVSMRDIRAEDIPKIETISDRDSYFLTVGSTGKRIIGGAYGESFTNIIKFIDRYSIKKIENTNDESWIVVNDLDSPVVNWIDPTDFQISQTRSSNGYEIRLFSEDGSVEITRDYGWSFDSFNGILHFNSDFKPGSSEWNKLDFGNPKIEGFIYIGKTIDSITENINDKVAEVNSIINSNCLAIQPFKFSTDKMTRLEDGLYQKKYSHVDFDFREWYQTYTFVVPGYCFELISLDRDETIITEMKHLPNGDTQIFVDLPYDINYEKPIVDYSYDHEVKSISNRYPILGEYRFIATTFVAQNGKKIPVKPLIDYDETQLNIPIGIPSGYNWTTPLGSGFIGQYPVGYFSNEPAPGITIDLDKEF